jgi:hypothetical protein
MENDIIDRARSLARWPTRWTDAHTVAARQLLVGLADLLEATTPLLEEAIRVLRHRGQTPAPGSPFALLFERIDAHFAAVKESGVPPEPWEDVPDEWTAAIKAAFPTRSGSHDEYGVAMQMVSHRHSKFELVALVNWLLVRIRVAADVVAIAREVEPDEEELNRSIRAYDDFCLAVTQGAPRVVE